MKALLSTAGALALIATSAAANPPGDRPVPGSNAVYNNARSDGNNSPTVLLKAKVFEYVAVWGTADAQTLNVAGVTAEEGVNNNNASGNARFNVTSNVEHDISLEWDTWDHSEHGPQANFSSGSESGDCSIGGTVHLDTDPTGEGGIISPTTEGELTPVRDASSGIGVPTWMKAYGIATEVTPNVTNCPGDIAKPDTYSLEVKITVSGNST